MQNTAHVLILVLQHSAQDAPSAGLGPRALKAAAPNAATTATQRSRGTRTHERRPKGTRLQRCAVRSEQRRERNGSELQEGTPGGRWGKWKWEPGGRRGAELRVPHAEMGAVEGGGGRRPSARAGLRAARPLRHPPLTHRHRVRRRHLQRSERGAGPEQDDAVRRAEQACKQSGAVSDSGAVRDRPPPPPGPQRPSPTAAPTRVVSQVRCGHCSPSGPSQ